MTNEAIEAAARAIKAELGRQFNAQPIHPDPAVDDWAATGGEINLTDVARAAAPALMEEGARLALEAAAKEANSQWRAVLDAKDILALSPAAIVKGAGHDRD